MNKHIGERWQGGNTENPLRLWAHVPGASVIIADFDVSKHMRHETKVANCRYARAAVTLCIGTSVEEVERLQARGLGLADILQRVSMLRDMINDGACGEQAKLTLRAIDVILGRA